MKRSVGRTAVVTAVTMLVFAATAAALSSGGYWAGETSQTVGTQASAFSLNVAKISHKHGLYVTRFTYRANYTGAGTVCASHFDASPTLIEYGVARFKGIKINGNRFADRSAPATSVDHVKISGAFKNGKLTGTFDEHFSTEDPQLHKLIHCDSGKVKFAAMKSQQPL